MTELISDSHHDDATPGLPPSPESDFGSDVPIEFEPAELGPEELREAYGGWLERRGIDPTSTPHLTMGQREFNLFRNALPSYLPYVTELYKIPSGDQVVGPYALVDVAADDPSLPPSTELVTVAEADFGTAIDPRRIAKDFQGTDPDSPRTPDSSPAYVTVDIGEALANSYGNLEKLATRVMQGETTDPFRSDYGDVAVRAGGLMPGQKDAYVWTTQPITKAVELTMLSPSTYDSVCVVRGQMRAAGNGKPGMAQIDDPTVVLKIAGEDLEELQKVSRELYYQPDFALTEVQRVERSQAFNSYVIDSISRAARINKQHEDDEEARRQPQVRYHERPS